MKKIKYRIRTIFGFSKNETNGFILLIIIIVLLLVGPWCIDFFYPSPPTSPQVSKKLDSLVAVLNSNSSSPQKKISREIFSPTSFVYFNPNIAKEAELAQVVGKKIAGTIVRFRAKGGKFYTKKDLQKIYGIDSLIYARVEKFIQLPSEFTKDKKETTGLSHSAYSMPSFDINKADTTELQKVKGIGKILSARIIKYRNRLGGFISEDQYKEVFGLDTIVLTALGKISFISNDFSPVKININKGSFSDLAAHPYIGKKYSGAIINYREQHKGFNSLDDLKLIRAIPAGDILRMLPYLDS